MSLQDTNFYNDSQAMQDYLSKSFAGNMIRYAPNGQAPIFALTSMLGTGVAKAVDHGYFAKTMVFPSVKVDNGGGYNSSATTLTVESTANILPSDLLQNPATSELMLVVSIASATSINVVRGIGGITAAAIADEAVLYGVGNAHEQASLRPPSRLMNPVRVMNKTQIFRNSWALPKTAAAIMPIVGDSLSGESKTDCGLFHAADIEKAIIFGQQFGRIHNQQYMTGMDGIIESVRKYAPGSNITTAMASIDYDELEAALDPVFNTTSNGKNPTERVLFVGGTSRKAINNVGRYSGQYQIVDGQTSFGMQFQTFKTSRGTFRMIEHPLLNSNPTWSQMAIALDLSAIRLMYLEGRQTENVEYGMDGRPTDNGIDAIGGTLTTELTMEITNPSAHAVLFGITGATAPT